MEMSIMIYGGIALIAFVVCLILGYFTKVDYIGQGVKLKFWNSLLIALFWPLMVLSLIAGWIYDVVLFCKNL